MLVDNQPFIAFEHIQERKARRNGNLFAFLRVAQRIAATVSSHIAEYARMAVFDFHLNVGIYDDALEVFFNLLTLGQRVLGEGRNHDGISVIQLHDGI